MTLGPESPRKVRSFGSLLSAFARLPIQKAPVHLSVEGAVCILLASIHLLPTTAGRQRELLWHSACGPPARSIWLKSSVVGGLTDVMEGKGDWRTQSLAYVCQHTDCEPLCPPPPSIPCSASGRAGLAVIVLASKQLCPNCSRSSEPDGHASSVERCSRSRTL